MSEIQRTGFSDGSYVKYSDHQAALTQAEAENEKLRKQLAECQQYIENLSDRLYGTQELWSDQVNAESIAQAQADADKHGVKVAIVVHGAYQYQVYPSQLTQAEATIAGLRELVAERDKRLAEYESEVNALESKSVADERWHEEELAAAQEQCRKVEALCSEACDVAVDAASQCDEYFREKFGWYRDIEEIRGKLESAIAANAKGE